MNEFFLSALSFGLAAGLKPGPLGIVVIQQALSRGFTAGARASFAPLITDGPIIIAALWFLSQFKRIDAFVTLLSLVGGLYLIWLAIKILRARTMSLSHQLETEGSLWTAVKVNLLNPSPYLFWFTVGGSYIVRGTIAQSLIFVITAIGTLVASKLAVAVMAARFMPAIESRGYLLAMRFLACMLELFGMLSITRAITSGITWAI